MKDIYYMYLYIYLFYNCSDFKENFLNNTKDMANSDTTCHYYNHDMPYLSKVNNMYLGQLTVYKRK